MAKLAVNLNLLFPTPMLVVDDLAVVDNDAWAEIILAKASVEPSENRSNIGGFQGINDNQYDGEGTTLFEWGLPDMQNIIDTIGQLLNESTAGAHSGVWTVGAWANVNRRGNLNMMHAHPGAYWSAVYYVRANPEEGGMIQFMDPRGWLPTMNNPEVHVSHEGCGTAGGCESFDAKTGRLVIFPSYLAHQVTPLEGDGPRISIAFNFRPTLKEPVHAPDIET